MTTDLHVAAVRLDAGARDHLVAMFTTARDSAAARGNATLAEFLNELLIVLCDARTAASADQQALEDDFARVIGIVGVGPADTADDGGAR